MGDEDLRTYCRVVARAEVKARSDGNLQLAPRNVQNNRSGQLFVFSTQMQL